MADDQLSFDDAIAQLLREFRGTGGQAEQRLMRAVNPGGVRTQRSANGTWRKAKYTASDLNEWIGQERRRLERIEARDAEPTGHPPVNAHASPKAKAGRKPKYDWNAIGRFVAEQMNHHDDFSAHDSDWQGMADLERAVQAKFAGSDGAGPAHGTLQPYLSAMVEVWRVARSCR